MNIDPLDQAFEFYGAGRLDAAAQVCRSVLAGNPGDTEANHLLGVVYFRHGDNATARDYMERATNSPKATAEMHNNLGSVLIGLGQTEAAIAAFNRALELKPDYADALNNLGVIHRNEKRIEAAIEAFSARSRSIRISQAWVEPRRLSRRGSRLAFRDDGRQGAQRRLRSGDPAGCARPQRARHRLRGGPAQHDVGAGRRGARHLV
jgi:predicted Zn-dependent protease